MNSVYHAPGWGNIMIVLRKLWWGGYPIGKAFWLFYVCGFFAALFVAVALLAIGYALHVGTPFFILGSCLLWDTG